MTSWENGEVNSECLSVIETDNLVTFFLCAKENNILKKMATIQVPQQKRKATTSTLKQVKLISQCISPRQKNGHEVPKSNSHCHSIHLDKSNHKKRQDSIVAKLDQ